MMNYYKRGQKVRIPVEFKVWNPNTSAWDYTDPTTVTLKVMSPSGQVSTYVYGTDAAVVRDATGKYHIDVVASAKKEYNIRAEGTGACVAVQEWAFGVKSVFPE